MNALRPNLRTWLIAAAIVAAIVIGVRFARSLRAPDVRAVLRDTITVLRARADSCRAEVDGDAAEMRAYGQVLDSMRARVRDMEALDPRGVPADSYVIYMAAFDAYNDSAALWAAREDSVRSLDSRCRNVAERHNLLADSLRRLILPISSPD